MTRKDNVKKREILDKTIPVIENFIQQAGLVLVEVDFVKESGHWFLRIFIYSVERPITHNDCENLTNNLDGYLNELIDIPYYLEVSSPGADRKLKTTFEYNIFRGKKVEIKLKKELENGIKVFIARLLDYSDESGLEVQVLSHDNNDILVLDKSIISSVKLKPEFNF